jgi:hypothetical protein
MRVNINKTSITQLTAIGISTYVRLGTPKSAEVELTMDTSASLVVRVVYSNNAGTTVVAKSVDYTIPDGSLKIVLPVAVDYQSVAVQWVSGTATTVDAIVKTNILG